MIVIVAIAGAAFILKNNKAKMHEQTELAKKVNATIPVQMAEVKEENIGGHLPPLAHLRRQSRFW